MLVRVVLVLAGLAVIPFALTRESDARACDHARAQAFALAVNRPGAGMADDGVALAHRITGRCRGSDALVTSSRALDRVGAYEGAALLARVSLQRDPQNFQAHDVAGLALERAGDPAGARREHARARALNPLAPAPQAPRIGPDGRPLSG